jgi:hypothetical protein
MTGEECLASKQPKGGLGGCPSRSTGETQGLVWGLAAESDKLWLAPFCHAG